MTTLDLEGVRERIRKNMPTALRQPVDPLTWTLIGEKDPETAYLASRCGSYTIYKLACQVSEADSEEQMMYFAWRVPATRMKNGLSVMATPLGSRLPTVEAAKELCDADWKEQSP